MATSDDSTGTAPPLGGAPLPLGGVPLPHVGAPQTKTSNLDERPSSTCTPHRFTPWRMALFWTAVTALPLVVYRDRVGELDGLSLGLGEITNGSGWLSDFAERLPQNGMKICLVVLIAATVLYTLAQAVALSLERSETPPGNATPSRFLRLLAARPGQIEPANYVSDLLTHGGDAALAPLRLGLSIFPLLGFLGTVIGLSGAIRDLPAAVSDKSKLEPVLSELYLAFDTTFLGLVGALVCLFAVRLAESRLDALAASHGG